jgi:anti-sigma B factor antagonist
MYLIQNCVATGGRVVGHGAPWPSRNVASRSSRAPLELVGLRPDDGSLTSGHGAVAGARLDGAAGQLAVRWERRAAVLIIWLSGALDRATAMLLDRELDAPAFDASRLIVDLTGLVFIDSSGLDSLLRIHHRASQRGHKLSFRHGSHIARRPLELTGAVQLRSRLAARHASVSDENPYFALAMACADVDHPAPDDRPRAA